MATLSARMLISNVASLFSARWGAVTEQAKQAGCSRQAIHKQEAHVVQAVEDAQSGRLSYSALQEENRCLREENRQLWSALETAVDFPQLKQQQFATTASAMGLSLVQIGVLLAIVLPATLCPKRATLGRWVQHSARRARALLAVLDRACQQFVLLLCLDEIFLRRRPVLMGVEPLSLAWVIGQRADDRSGQTWCAALQPWGQVQYTAVDGGTGLKRGLELTRQQRAEAGSAVPLEANLDNFHIQQEGQQALAASMAGGRKGMGTSRSSRQETGGSSAARTQSGRTDRAGASGLVPRRASLFRSAKPRGGLSACRGRFRVVPIEWTTQQSCLGRGRVAGGAARVVGRTLGQVPAHGAGLAGPDVPGPLAARVDSRGAPTGVTSSFGDFMASASSSSSGERGGRPIEGSRSRSRSDPGRYLRKAGGGLADSLPSCGPGAAPDSTGQQRGRMHEQHLAHAPGTPPEFEPGSHRPETTLLGLQLPTYNYWELLRLDPAELQQQMSTTGVTK